MCSGFADELYLGTQAWVVTPALFFDRLDPLTGDPHRPVAVRGHRVGVRLAKPAVLFKPWVPVGFPK
jgi:hypothetical protein